MGSTHDDHLPVIYADIENLQRELEQLCVSLKAGPAEENTSNGPADTIVFRGK